MKHAYIFKHLLKEWICCFYDPHMAFRNESVIFRSLVCSVSYTKKRPKKKREKKKEMDEINIFTYFRMWNLGIKHAYFLEVNSPKHATLPTWQLCDKSVLDICQRYPWVLSPLKVMQLCLVLCWPFLIEPCENRVKPWTHSGSGSGSACQDSQLALKFLLVDHVCIFPTRFVPAQ